MNALLCIAGVGGRAIVVFRETFGCAGFPLDARRFRLLRHALALCLQNGFVVVLELLSILAPVYLVIGVGFGWRRLGRRVDNEFVADLCMNVGAPCLIFSSLLEIEIDLDNVLELAGIVVLAHLAFTVVGYVFLRAADWPTTSFLSPVIFANTGNMGLPVCLFAFGREGLAYGVVFFVVTTLLHFTAGQWVWTGRPSLRIIARTPLAYAAILALTLSAADLTPPSWLRATTTTLGGITIPLMQFTLGVSLAQLKVSNLPKSVVLSVLRLGMGFAVGVGLAELFDLEGVVRAVVILNCAMPVAVINYLFAERYQRTPSDVASLVVLSTTLSFATVPLILIWLL